MFNSQVGQEHFVLKSLNYKRNGYFLDIGSHHPKYISNTYLLEKNYGWNGLMVEYDDKWEQSYKDKRTSHYIIEDATKVDYLSLFKKYSFPANMDYLQIDLEVDNGSTINVLDLLDSTVFKHHTFSTVTFEHDFYRGDFFNTRARSREIFERNGYVMVFSDVRNFEDWWVYPAFVNMEYIKKVRSVDKVNDEHEVVKKIYSA